MNNVIPVVRGQPNQCTVLGAGMVGVACALELQRLGFAVTLVDKNEPGQETSSGNGGVIARSSLIPLNNPTLLKALPSLLKNNQPQLRYSPGFVLRNFSWARQFLQSTQQSVFEETAIALDALIRLSTSEHLRLIAQAAVGHRLRSTGWIFLYRSEKAFDAGAFSRAVYDRFEVKTQTLHQAELSELEPHLAPRFPKSLWIRDAFSVDNPGEIVRAYATMFMQGGGRFVRSAAKAMTHQPDGCWSVQLENGDKQAADHVVVALGPWSREFLRKLHFKIPMGFERGYHQHFEPTAGASLNRPIYDTAKGYIMTPMEHGIRLTTGVELTDHLAQSNLMQLHLGEQAAREIFPLGSLTKDPVWRGARPTLPDSRPMIGALPGAKNLWAAFGHQHIGFSTSTGTAALLGSLIRGLAVPINPTPYSPSRFVLR
jgi:D-amino-acid dehydrogenase